MGELAGVLEDEQSGTFVRWGLSEPGEAGDYWILFTDEPTAATLSRIADLPTDTRVVFGAAASAEELGAISGALVSSLASHNEVYTFVGTRSDRYTGAITVRYMVDEHASEVRGDGDLAAYAATALAAGNEASPDGRLPVPVTFTRIFGTPAVAEVVVQGGRSLWDPGSGVELCTAGFTAEVGGDRGLLTARHCPNYLRYNNLSGVISTNPDVASEAVNGQVDLQWHRTLTGNGHSTNKQFRATGTNPDVDDRTVTSVANAGLGSVVCHWGFATGYDCAFVEDVDQCLTLSGTTYCGIDTTDEDVSTGGDSGGPWFLGNIARGSHSGGSDGVASFFTRIGRVANNLNGTVLED